MLLHTPKVELGWQAPDFTLKDPDGKSYTLAELQDGKPLLIAFICNHCPYVIAIIERLVADAKTLQNEGINVVAIMPNDYHSYPADNPERMQEFAKQHGFTFPYLINADQSVAKAFEAVCTPDFFGLNNKGELHYRGRLDDAEMRDPKGRTPELIIAMRHINEHGTGPAGQVSSMGCSIKWK
ncbi:MAG: thioredoxin family protein [Gammaproteobacteria bacterium]|nr:thioredoxin family protein [Gammaproteobacteria bacterium]NNM14393.1 thioredoxin family protein [Gammaproteobacteria bacterium]